MKLKFKRDTAFRKQFFVPDSFAHPAKMDAQLLIWIVERYTEVGETILDPMAGMGTTMLACGLGRNVVLNELEEKFCKMCRDNWEQVKMRPRLGYGMGWCVISQGDARNLEGLLVGGSQKKSPHYLIRNAGLRHLDSLPQVDAVVSSPPYAETGVGDWQTGRAEFQAWVITELATKGYVEWQGKKYTESEWRAMNHGRLDGRTTKGVHKHPSNGYSDNPQNIGNLPYGQIDKIVTSPPFGEAQKGSGLAKNPPKSFRGVLKNFTQKQGDDINNVSNLPYGNIDAVITSPPYEGSLSGDAESKGWEKLAQDPTSNRYGRKSHPSVGQAYSAITSDNIGNLKSQSYLEAMLQVYRQCHKVLKPNGLMILVLKNFIRNKQVVRLDLDTIKLCEQAGFELIERHYRKLPAQSFWRIIYHQKHPEVELIDKEDILVFRGNEA